MVGKAESAKPSLINTMHTNSPWQHLLGLNPTWKKCLWLQKGQANFRMESNHLFQVCTSPILSETHLPVESITGVKISLKQSAWKTIRTAKWILVKKTFWWNFHEFLDDKNICQVMHESVWSLQNKSLAQVMNGMSFDPSAWAVSRNKFRT